jgi:hypothetical protein
MRRPAIRRLLVGLVVALVCAAGGTLYANEGIWAALCASFPKDSPEWMTFFCYLL